MLVPVSTVVVLNGTSSSGKTSVARAFQDLAPGLFLNFSIDSILSTLPPAALARIASGADISDVDYPRLARAFYACVGRLLELGHNLVIDNAITARYQAELLVSTLESHDVLMVGINCPPDVLTERERARGDRQEGLAARQGERIHFWLLYDLMIDTAGASPQQAASRVALALAAGTRGAFEKTGAKLGKNSAGE